jgi:hypothetical protein
MVKKEIVGFLRLPARKLNKIFFTKIVVLTSDA